MTGYENLKYLADITSKLTDEEIRQAMEKVGLNPDDKRVVGKYSLGMRQKLTLVQAFMEEPQLLLLDEPTNALDADTVEKIRMAINIGKKERITVLASHNADDIKILCDYVYYMNNGKMEMRV